MKIIETISNPEKQLSTTPVADSALRNLVNLISRMATKELGQRAKAYEAEKSQDRTWIDLKLDN